MRLDIKYGGRMEELQRKVKRPIRRKEMQTRLPVITNKDLLQIEILKFSEDKTKITGCMNEEHKRKP